MPPSSVSSSSEWRDVVLFGLAGCVAYYAWKQQKMDNFFDELVNRLDAPPPPAAPLLQTPIASSADDEDREMAAAADAEKTAYCARLQSEYEEDLKRRKKKHQPHTAELSNDSSSNSNSIPAPQRPSRVGGGGSVQFKSTIKAPPK